LKQFILIVITLSSLIRPFFINFLLILTNRPPFFIISSLRLPIPISLFPRLMFKFLIPQNAKQKFFPIHFYEVRPRVRLGPFVILVSYQRFELYFPISSIVLTLLLFACFRRVISPFSKLYLIAVKHFSVKQQKGHRSSLKPISIHQENLIKAVIYDILCALQVFTQLRC
jgi:hypothetical protein